MTNKEIWAELAHKIKELFRVKLNEFRTEDFVAVADLLGFHAYKGLSDNNFYNYGMG